MEKYKKVNFIHTTLSKNISPNMLAIQSIKKNVKNKVSFGLHSAEDEMIVSAISLEADPIKNDKIDYDSEIRINMPWINPESEWVAGCLEH